MLYSKEDLPCPDDAYDLLNFPRDDQKEAILTILNAKSDTAAVASLRYDKGIKNAKQLCNALKKRHAPISKYFFKGEGLKLQCLDSQVAEAIMLKALDRGVVVLPIHDSFIIEKKNEDVLKVLMSEAFDELLPNATAKFKPKDTLYDYAFKGPDDPGKRIFLNVIDWENDIADGNE
jgi:hypothetical protein